MTHKNQPLTQAERLASGAQIRLARVRQGLTQQALAERVGVHRAVVNRLERGRTTPHYLTKCALEVALGIKIDL